ncbi:FAD dependent oxidoreductase [Haliangium ochraceum DSM 14365]|uniref:Glycerol-3-phosphate dehydrogenase n=1 Tax=Haliangium ochraceum (strain DSM 14365 / JCM 11303 / SMP-2) TaxID=502025 RepID=D0LHD2_HALO1|nr:FAD dependent oxidoreductase [Haliangium ochraceum DSM 14365]
MPDSAPTLSDSQDPSSRPEASPQEPYDLVIVGGGITGAGVARDAALRGLRVALFEKSDYGSGTSSKSSKLIHGGLRYLEHGEIGLVFESVSERAVQGRVAPHLVKPLPFLVPVYEGARWGVELMNIGLWIYDTLSLFRAPKLHKTFRGTKALDVEPALRREGLRGAIEYYDCFTDDARLVLENIVDARAAGALCRSYTEVVELLRDEGGRVSRVRVRDRFTGEDSELRTRAVIMAAGAWTDEAADKLSVDTAKPILRRTKGVHAVFPAEGVKFDHAITMASPVDGRVMFAVPWRSRIYVGTTDTDFEGTADEVYASAEDIAYLCDSAKYYFPEVEFTPERVIATWAGLRPLVQDADAEDEGSVSREHEIFVRDDGILIVAGGKLTTYRRMALEVLKHALRWLDKNHSGALDGRDISSSATKQRPLPGAEGLAEASWDGIEALGASLAEQCGLEPEVGLHLAATYGVRAEVLANRIAEAPGEGERMQPDLPYVWAEVAFAVEHDLACTLDDVLARRIPLLLVGRDQGLDVAERVAEQMAALLAWSDERHQRELAEYRDTVATTRRFRD